MAKGGNQDSLGIQATLKYEDSPGCQIWVKQLSNGDTAVMMLNRTTVEKNVSLYLEKIGCGKCSVRDLWEHRNVGIIEKTFSATIPPHGVKFLRLKPI